MSAELEQARETNRRLNRRLGDMEGSLNTLVSKAQHEASQAIERAAIAQRITQDRLCAWEHELERSHTAEISACIAILVAIATSLWAIGATIWAVLK